MPFFGTQPRACHTPVGSVALSFVSWSQLPADPPPGVTCDIFGGRFLKIQGFDNNGIGIGVGIDLGCFLLESNSAHNSGTVVNIKNKIKTDKAKNLLKMEATGRGSFYSFSTMRNSLLLARSFSTKKESLCF